EPARHRFLHQDDELPRDRAPRRRDRRRLGGITRVTQVHLDYRSLEEHLKVAEVPHLGLDLRPPYGAEPLAQERGRPVHLSIPGAPAASEDVWIEHVRDAHLRLVVKFRE